MNKKYTIKKLCGINSYMAVPEEIIEDRVKVDQVYEELKKIYGNIRVIGKIIKIRLEDAEISIFPDGVIYSKGLSKENLRENWIRYGTL